MFEVNMDEYLEEETEYIKNNLNSICANWEKQVSINIGQRPRHIDLRVFVVWLIRIGSQSGSPVDLFVFLQSRSNEAQRSRRIPGCSPITSHNCAVDRFIRC